MSKRKPETFYEYKAGDNFNRKNIIGILRIKIIAQGSNQRN